MKSIRVYLVIALLSTITLINFLAATRGYQKSMEQTQKLLDRQLADTAVILESLPANASDHGAVVEQTGTERLAFQIWSQSGALLMRSANAGHSPISDIAPGYQDQNFGGYRWRVLSQFDEQHQRWILVAERLDIRVELADGIITQSVLPILLSLPLVAIIIWLVVSHGLAQVTKLAKEVSSKRADDLTRLQTSNPPKELAAVVSAINGLLQRLEDSVQRERRFSADAAHELRTPLAAIKVHVHNLQETYPQIAEESQALTADLNRLGHLIEQIMLLYRTTPEHYQSRMSLISLQVLAQQVIGELFARIDARQQTISLRGSAPDITGDESSLRILLQNLIINASKYSHDGAVIDVELAALDGRIQLRVIDNGPGIATPSLSRVTDRFYRVGGDRHDSHVTGCGLGLSIVKHIAELHQATLHLENNANGEGLTVCVDFPAQLKITAMTEVRKA